MRLLAVCVAVLVVFAGFTVATVIDTRNGPDPFEPHPPDSDEEDAAAAIATRFADAVSRDDAAAACRLAAGGLAEQMRCATPRPLLLACSGAVFHAKEDDDAVDVRMENCHLRVVGQRVIEWVPLVGLA
jgi:hypothetical protein